MVFLDIEMPQMSGTELAGSLPEPRPFVVFATAFDRYALDAFAVDATDYLVKPITRARLAGTLDARTRAAVAPIRHRARSGCRLGDAGHAPCRRTLPTIDGYESSAITLPARGVGGDFFVAQQIGPHRLVVALGDVSGKGMPAGLVASSLQARLETAALHAAGSAGDIVSDVNSGALSDLGAARFATLAYVDLDLANHQQRSSMPATCRRLWSRQVTHQRFCRQPARRWASSRARTSRARSLTLPEGASLVLYSDGVTEAFDQNGDEFGESRLVDVITTHVSARAEELCQAVLDARQQHARHTRRRTT